MNNEKLFSLEAEAAVLGSIVFNPSCFGEVLLVLGVEAFFTEENKSIYEALAHLFIENIPIDAVSLRGELKSRNQLKKIGGVEYLARVLQSVPSSANVIYYAKIVRERQLYRNLVLASEQIQAVLDEPIRVDEQIEKVQEITLGLEGSTTAKEYFTMRECVALSENEQEQSTIIETGFRNIDNIIEGFRGGDFIIPAGRPSMGKTALALQIAINAAKAGISVIFFTLEMSELALTQRASLYIEPGQLAELDIIIHKGCATPEQQIAFIKTRKQSHKVDIVFIDYLQLMHTGKRSENRVQEVTIISRKLKLAAVCENIPIVALCQLNRQVESRDKHRPRLSDLRESGAIEQDADIVMLINREDYYRKNEDPNAEPDGSAELIIAKNRNGRTGIANLIFLDEQVKFADRTYERTETYK